MSSVFVRFFVDVILEVSARQYGTALSSIAKQKTFAATKCDKSVLGQPTTPKLFPVVRTGRFLIRWGLAPH
jgi:hypothetical protein